MNFKLLRGKEDYNFLRLEPVQQLTLTRPSFTLANVEFCFQFDDEEPVVFGSGPNECSIRLASSPDGNMTFNNNGRIFKLFARERQDD